MTQITHAPFDLVHRPGRVFETLGLDEHCPPRGIKGGRHWAHGDFEDGHTLESHPIPMSYMVVDFYFVLPRLPRDEPGKYPILSVARGQPDSFREVFLHLVWEPCKDRFVVSANAGSRSSELQELALERSLPLVRGVPRESGEPAADVTGRLLHATVLIARNGLFPGIEDPFTGESGLAGELTLAEPCTESPWGGSPSGTWWITSGTESEHDEEERCFPAGFGLCDLQITVFDEHDADYRGLPYSGALDTLVAERRHGSENPFDWDADTDSAAKLGPALLKLAEDVRIMAGGFSTWVRRAEELAGESEQLGLRVCAAYGDDEEADLPY